MLTLLIAVGVFVGYLVAYHTYGRWLSRRIFNLDVNADVPSRQLRDDVDYVPTRKEVIFGHHFTSIAGTGPIVGPAIAVFWGWLPALLWVLFGSVFIGAVHDFSALVISLRNRGQTVGEIAGRMVTPRAKYLFLVILFFALTIVLAIFGLVIAVIFSLYPESVLSVWIAMPLAVAIGLWVYKKGGALLWPSLGVLALLYLSIYVGTYYLPLDIRNLFAGASSAQQGQYAVIAWTIVLFVYCFVASVLPVWLLLQPRDYINSHQLIVALVLLMLGIVVAGATGQADLLGSAPAIADNIPADAPPIFPFLFITVACGAVSGFHCLVSSGTSSKQVACEPDAQCVGYGAMLLEGALAVIVILACCAGVGMGKFDRVGVETGSGYEYRPHITSDTGQQLVGREAWLTRYDASKGWHGFSLGAKVGAFIEGGANFLSTVGLPLKMAIGIMAVLVACFAATTLDTATRLQRYVIQELAQAAHLKQLTNKYVATTLAVVLGGAVAMLPGPKGPGSGGLILWPLFGATNQLLAGLAFMVTAFYLWRRGKPVFLALIPMGIMLIMPVWALSWKMFNQQTGWCWGGGDQLFGLDINYLLLGFGIAIIVLQVWMVIEGILSWPRARGVLEQALPPLEAGRRSPAGTEAAATEGRRSC